MAWTWCERVCRLAKREQLEMLHGPLTEKPGFNLALTVLHVPSLLDSESAFGVSEEGSPDTRREGYDTPFHSQTT